MDKDLVNSLFRETISDAKGLVSLREQALKNAQRKYKQAEKILSSMEDNLHSAKCELEYFEKHKREAMG